MKKNWLPWTKKKIQDMVKIYKLIAYHATTFFNKVAKDKYGTIWNEGCNI